MKILTTIFFCSILITFSSHGQFLGIGGKKKPRNQCKALRKKREANPDNVVSNKSKNSVAPRRYYYNDPVISPERLAQERAEAAREKQSANQLAENKESPEKAENTQFKFKTFQPDNTPPVDLDDLPEPVSEKHAKIRKMVADMIRNGEADQPITESLYFITAEDEFAYVDFEPFLMAVEFALQGKMVLVEGHTDSRGSKDYNVDLSMKRVRQIERLMLEIGVPQDRISVMGYGEDQAKYDNSTKEGRQKNRRVDFKIY